MPKWENKNDKAIAMHRKRVGSPHSCAGASIMGAEQREWQNSRHVLNSSLCSVLIFLAITSCSTATKRKIAHSKTFMIATQGTHATRAGAEMFARGGNVFDAFAAISFTISVERPQSTGLGGGGFLTYYKKGMRQPQTVDFREKAPLKAHARLFQDESGKIIPRKSLDGVYAGGVPGLVAGVVSVHRRFGKLPLKTVVAPAIKLAREGFDVYPELARALAFRRKVLERFPATQAIFFKDGRPLKEGERLVQRDLAKTLELIAQRGRDGFYKGPVAKAIVDEMTARQGLITREDLNRYQVKERPPVQGIYRGYKIYSMGPPSSGGAHIIQILNILELYSLKELGFLSSRSIHLSAMAMQRAFADRARSMGDPDFVHVPLKKLISKDYAKKWQEKKMRGRSGRALKAEDVTRESSETTHFTVMDREGNTISSTQTINGWMGSGLVIPGTGVILNNEMDDFTSKVGAANLFGAVGGEKNIIAPEKRPLSSMSPTIVFKGGTPVLALGTPGGTRIITCVLQVLLNVLEYGLPLPQAVGAPRFHHQWKPDQLSLEPRGFPKGVPEDLKGLGYSLAFKPSGCKTQAVAKEGEGARAQLLGVSDPRGEGLALGK